MSKQNRLFWQDDIEQWVFQCVGCECLHGFTRQWTFNGNMQKPTVMPSIIVRGTEGITDDEHKRIMDGEKIDPKPFVCHFFIRDGKMIYLEDSTRALKGQTVDIPLWEEV
ncbi:MAG: hypothetical protein LUM44_17675 [Pyrinomonadaceae bacterium]|nr:hypothetical protein [Pyrinomonadaceae bacterium]